MNEENKRDVTAVIDALATLHGELASMAHDLPVTSEWSEYAGKVINNAVAVIIEYATVDNLQTAMIDLLTGLHARTLDERDAARAELARVRVQQGGVKC